MKPLRRVRVTSGKRIAKKTVKWTKRERCRLAQLVASLGIFAIALLSRSVFPLQLEKWNEVLRSEVDFKGAFSDFGASAAQGRPLLDSLSELCVEVFGGERIQLREYAAIVPEIPALTERCREWSRTLSPEVSVKLP